jgi:hypothetical protein
MRRIITIALALAGAFLFAPSARAQFTTVTATVVDPNGIPYGAGTMSAVLVPGSSGGYTLSGRPYSGRVGPVTLDSTGKFTANFGDVTLITPGSPQWLITINSNQGGIEAPLGTGAQTFTFTSTGTTISGSSPVDISASLNALAPKLTNITIGAGTVTSVAATSPIVVTPSPITGTGTISCPTCSTSSSTVPINNVVSATGPITAIADGNNPLEIDCALTSGAFCFKTGETTAATTAGAVEDQITTLTTSTAIPLNITQGTAGPAGAAAPFVFEISNAARGGVASGASSGFAGAGILLQTGTGSAAGATGTTTGAGGQLSIDLGSSSFNGCSLSTCNGGNGGAFSILMGNGDNGGATGNGGIGGTFQISGRNGGNGGATSGTGGRGTFFLFQGGNGGNAAVGSTTGAGGSATFTLGAAGLTGTPGAPGIFSIVGPSVLGANTSPLLNLSETWNTAGVVDAAIFLNITNTASGAGSKLMDLQVNSVSQFSVDKSGIVSSGIDNSLAGTFQASNSAAAAHTIWGSQATTSNEVDGPATAIANGDIVSMTTVGTVQKLTDGGLKAVNTANVYACGTGTTCTSVLLNLPHIFFGTATLVSGTPSTVTVSGLSPSFGGAGTYVCTLAAQSNATTALFSVANVSGSSFTITGPSASTTAVNYICTGN